MNISESFRTFILKTLKEHKERFITIEVGLELADHLSRCPEFMHSKIELTDVRYNRNYIGEYHIACCDVMVYINFDLEPWVVKIGDTINKLKFNK